MAGSLLIGHDVGTQGSKSVLIDRSGNLLAACFEPYEISHPRPNWAEQNPDLWWQAVTAGTRAVLEKSGADPSSIAGMGFAGQMIGIVPVDVAGEPVMPAIIWMDSRADEQAARMVRRMGGARITMALAGAIPTGKDVVCKLAWLKEEAPDVVERTETFLDVAGYLVLKATGKKFVDHTGAGGTGILSNRTRQWSPVLARATGVPLEKMPPVASSVDIVGGLTRAAADEMGLPVGTPVIAGMADIPAAATGSGALEDGDAHIYLGTSSWLCLSLSRPKHLGHNGMVSVASPDPEMFIMIGESETAGLCLKWFADTLASADELARSDGEAGIFEVLDRVAAGVAPGAGNLIFTPWLFGERSPVGDTTVRGCFANLGLEHTREQMLRSVYEGVAFNLRWMLEAVERTGYACDPVRAIGGGARSDFWMQVMADVTGRTVEAVEHPQEAGAVGCALAVAVGLGLLERYRDIKRVVRVRGTFEPDSSLASMYGDMFESFKDVYPALSCIGRRLNDGKN